MGGGSSCKIMQSPHQGYRAGTEGWTMGSRSPQERAALESEIIREASGEEVSCPAFALVPGIF